MTQATTLLKATENVAAVPSLPLLHLRHHVTTESPQPFLCDSVAQN